MKRKVPSNFVFLIDSRGIVQAHNDDSQRRHQSYAYKLYDKDHQFNFHVISATSRHQINMHKDNFFQSYIKCHQRFSLKYVLKSVRIIRSTKSSKSILIAGDPWEAALSANLIAFILKRAYKIDCPIQIQVHADITGMYWRKASNINRARYYLAKFILRKASHIRTVSEMQKKGLVNNYLIEHRKIIVAPVELNLPTSTYISSFNSRPRSIGFAGRFHKDRAIFEFIEYVKKLDPNTRDLTIILAGDGELLEGTLLTLAQILPPERFEYCGNLSASQMRDFWPKIGVYVSLATSESYGRAIREAIYNGVPVLGAKSSGFDALSKLGIPWICEVNWEDSPKKLQLQLESMLTIVTDQSARIMLQNESNVFSQILIDSWISMSKA